MAIRRSVGFGTTLLYRENQNRTKESAPNRYLRIPSVRLSRPAVDLARPCDDGGVLRHLVSFRFSTRVRSPDLRRRPRQCHDPNFGLQSLPTFPAGPDVPFNSFGPVLREPTQSVIFERSEILEHQRCQRAPLAIVSHRPQVSEDRLGGSLQARRRGVVAQFMSGAELTLRYPYAYPCRCAAPDLDTQLDSRRSRLHGRVRSKEDQRNCAAK